MPEENKRKEPEPAAAGPPPGPPPTEGVAAAPPPVVPAPAVGTAATAVTAGPVAVTAQAPDGLAQAPDGPRPPKKRATKPGPPGSRKSEHKGVGWVQKVNKWQASIWLQPQPGEGKGKTVFLGYWDSEAQALEVFSEALAAREAGQPIPEHLRRTKKTTSKHFGVSLVKRTGKYTAQIRCNGKQHYVGTYSTEDLAKEGYDRAAQQIADTVRRHRPSSEAARLTAACLLGCRRVRSSMTRSSRSPSTAA